MVELATERLLLRQWREADKRDFAALNADEEVRRFFPGILTSDESAKQFDILRDGIATHGFGFWAVEVTGREPFIGFVGIQQVPFEAPFTPAVEIGWRLARRFWGNGYATEGARAALAHGFDTLRLGEVVAMVVPDNLASRRVMDRLGMRHAPEDDFDHPRVSADSPLRRHTLYRLTRADWHAGHAPRRVSAAT